MPKSHPVTVAEIARLAHGAAAAVPDPTCELIKTIRVTMATGADPYIVIGILIQAAATVVTKSIPPQARPKVATASVAMLINCLQSNEAKPR
jgi:hypothetical protein